MEELELFDLDGEDIDAAEDANYISSADDREEEDEEESAAETDGAEDEDTPMSEIDLDTQEERPAAGSLFPIRTSEGLIHQERRRRPRREVDPADDEQHPDYAITLTKGVTNRPVKRIFLPHARAQLLAVLFFILSVALLCFILFSVIYIAGNRRLKLEQARELAMYREENETLIGENTELRALVNRLSVSVNRNLEDRRSEEAAYEASFLPRGYPLSQTTQSERAFLDTDGHLYPADDSPEGAMPIALFTTRPDLYVIAAGTGVVTRILPDPNFGTMLTIDHRNGYASVYRIDGEVLVDVGDMVSRGDRLFSIGEKEEEAPEGDMPPAEDEETVVETTDRLGYQIHLNDSYLSPEDLIEING